MKIKSICEHCHTSFLLDADTFLKFKGNFCSSSCGTSFRKLTKKKPAVEKPIVIKAVKKKPTVTKTVIKTVTVKKTTKTKITTTKTKTISEKQIDWYCYPAMNETIAVNKI